MNRFQSIIIMLIAVVGVVLSHAAAHAQDVEANTLKLGLGGYSPVSYFTEDAPKPGSPLHRAMHDGVTYFFQHDAEVRAFKRNPGKYVPAYNGWCAYGMAVEGKFDADPTNYEIVNGRLCVFLKNDQVDTRDLWNRGDQRELVSKANTYYASLKNRTSRAYLHSANVSGDGIAIGGYSPVSYFTKGQAERGSADHAVEHAGLTYLLVDARQVEMFKADPEKYVPAYGGWCAFGMSVQDKFPVDPTAFKIVDGRLLLFLRNENIDARALWQKGDEAQLKAKAAAHWKKVSG